MLGENVTNSTTTTTTTDCNYYGDGNELRDLLDRGWDCKSDSIFEP